MSETLYLVCPSCKEVYDIYVDLEYCPECMIRLVVMSAEQIEGGYE